MKKTCIFALILSVCLFSLPPVYIFAGDSNYSCNLGGLWTNEVYEKEDTVNTQIGAGFNMHFADFLTVGSEIWAYYIDTDSYGKMAIGLAKSTDGINFTDNGVVLSTSPGGWDNNMSSFPGIYYYNGVYYLTYEGAGTNCPGDIGLATSTDGVNFTKQGKILTHNTTGWESVNIGTPDLYRAGNNWYLTYHGYNGVDCQVGVASGTNIYSLTKYSANPVIGTSSAGADSGTIGRRDVTYYNGYYYMVYEISTEQPYASAKWTHTFARSTNMLDWSVLPQKNIISQSNYEMANDGPSFLTWNGVTWIYYRNEAHVKRARLANELNGGYDKAIEAEGMNHQNGRADGEGWSANTAQDSEGFIVYGSYSTDIPQGEVTAVFKARIDNNTADNLNVLRIEAVDMTVGKVVASREITRTMFSSTNHYEFFSLPFNNYYTGHTMEFRAYWYDHSYINVDRILVNYGNSCRIPPSTWQYQAEGMQHLIGRADGAGWSANPAQDGFGCLLYGPYTADIAQGIRKINFRMKIDSNTGDNSSVVRIEVYNGTINKIVAQANITRQQFDESNQYQDFSLIFNQTTEGDSLEFRVVWYDVAAVNIDYVLVEQTSPAAWIYEAEALSHQIGRGDGTGWSANTAQDNDGFLVYGPYDTSVSTGVWNASFFMYITNNSINNEKVASIEVFDSTSGVFLAQMNVTRQQFAAINQYQEFKLPFTNTIAGHSLEFRVHWIDKADLNLDKIVISANTPSTSVYEAENMNHAIGRADSPGWSANTVQDNANYLVFGPYTTSIQKGLRTAYFKMKIDNNTNDNLNVLRLEVSDATNSTILAQTDITRQQFNGSSQYQDFGLSFINATAGHSLEFRVYWYDNSILNVDKIVVD